MAAAIHPDPCWSEGETTDALNRVCNSIADAMNEAERIRDGARMGNASRSQVGAALDLGHLALALTKILGAVPAAATDADPSLTTEAKEAA